MLKAGFSHDAVHVIYFPLFIGNDFMKIEKFSDALECYSKALKLDNKNSVYYCNR